MPTSRFFKSNLQPSANNASKGSQPQARTRPRLSKEVLAILRARRQAATEKYQVALREAYTAIEQQIAAIAEAHGKKVQCVRGDLHMAAQISLNRHSRKSPWNAFIWKKSADEKENNPDRGNVPLAN